MLWLGQKLVSTACTGHFFTNYMRNQSNELQCGHLSGEATCGSACLGYQDCLSAAKAWEEPDYGDCKQWAVPGGYGPAGLLCERG